MVDIKAPASFILSDYLIPSDRCSLSHIKLLYLGIKGRIFMFFMQENGFFEQKFQK